MAPMSIPLTILLPQLASAFAPTYDFVGRGYCQDAKHQSYEGWYAAGWNLKQLIYKEDANAECSCPECEELCDANERCQGYEFYCCPENVRCEGGASVLFSYGTRPTELPPSPFSWIGPRGSETIGLNFKGEGPIVSLINSTGASCYSKPAPSMQVV